MLPWSEGYAYQAVAGQTLNFKLHLYNFATNTVVGRLQVARQPSNWDTSLRETNINLDPMQRREIVGTLRIPNNVEVRDGWVVLRADCGQHGQPTLAFRVIVSR